MIREFRILNDMNYFTNKVVKTNIKTDIIKSEEKYKVVCELPGFEKENIKIVFENNVLSIQALKKEEDENEMYIFKERGNNNVERKFQFNENIDVNSISAEFKDGILIIELKQKENIKTKIEIM